MLDHYRASIWPIFFALITIAAVQIVLTRADIGPQPWALGLTITAAILWLVIAVMVDRIIWSLGEPAALRMKARLVALCVGFSIKPFDWHIGDQGHLRRPGGGLYAFGPLRFAWRFTEIPAKAEPMRPTNAGDVLRGTDMFTRALERSHGLRRTAE